MRISDWSSDVCSSDLHRCIIPRDGKIDLQGLEIAIVYPEKATFELKRLLHFGWIVDLHQNIHAQLACGGFQLAHLQQVQTGDDQQYAVRAKGPRLCPLPGVAQDILAEIGSARFREGVCT